MKIHEYQAKGIFRNFGIPTPSGAIATSPDGIDAALDALGATKPSIWVVKAQVHAGGRGKGGGVKLAKSRGEAREQALQMFGMQLVTHQTGPEGQQVRRVYIEGGADIQKEFYLGMVQDRETSTVAVMASSEGGMDIEEVAANRPEKILKEFAHPALGLQEFQARRLAFSLGLEGKAVRSFVKVVMRLYDVFTQKDCSLVEINPLVLQGDGSIIALDGKINFDDNALFRHPDVLELRDLDEEDPREIEASKFDLSYIKLDGDIGCLVNGAGLAMSTMDIVKEVGMEPANFLDVGGGATTEKVTAAFRIILGDEVKAVFVNIFGGIMKCDTIAEGIVAAAKEVGIHVPLIVRLEGTNVELGKKILAESGLNVISASSMLDGAEKVAAAVRANG